MSSLSWFKILFNECHQKIDNFIECKINLHINFIKTINCSYRKRNLRTNYFLRTDIHYISSKVYVRSDKIKTEQLSGTYVLYSFERLKPVTTAATKYCVKCQMVTCSICLFFLLMCVIKFISGFLLTSETIEYIRKCASICIFFLYNFKGRYCEKMVSRLLLL